MEPIIEIKDYQMKEIRKMLAPDERMLAAIPCGRVHVEQGRPVHTPEGDYLVLTDKRIIEVKGRFFRDHTGFNAYPRRLATDADVRHYLLGSTLKVLFRNEVKQGEEFELVFLNCDRTAAEAIVHELTNQLETRRCPRCMKKLTDDFTFCPYCRAVLKKLCSHCGKPRNQDLLSCPHCGG